MAIEYITVNGRRVFQSGSDGVLEGATGADLYSNGNYILLKILAEKVPTGNDDALVFKRSTKEIDDTDSPYSAVALDDVIYCDTDSASITLNLPAGSAGLSYKIVNCGTSGNNVVITPNGSELIDGVNSSKNLGDKGVIDLVYSTSKGWW
jgi:hypothetical protein